MRRVPIGTVPADLVCSVQGLNWTGARAHSRTLTNKHTYFLFFLVFLTLHGTNPPKGVTVWGLVLVYCAIVAFKHDKSDISDVTLEMDTSKPPPWRSVLYMYMTCHHVVLF